LVEEHLVQMTRVQEHRGPDAEGIFYDQDAGIGLGHRRLSVLDLSEAANQPFTSSDGRFEMVYNGELYNYKSIKSGIKDIPWKSKGDTEVIIEAYAKYGSNMLENFNGMFALAIFDTKADTFFLARDRMGIKPLYYYWDGEVFAFASELKAFKCAPLTLNLNKEAINRYLHLGYIPDNLTIYKNVFCLPAGSYCLKKGSSLKIERYWQLEDQLSSKVVTDFSEAKRDLTELLFNSVERRLVSDVPLGIFLSGGTDSSIITSIASKTSPQSVKTFSIGFKEEEFNESEKAKAIASHLSTDHHEYIVSHDQAVEMLEKVMENFDQPFADSSALPTYVLSDLAKKDVTVALSGDGGDELFMGYGAYKWAKRLSNPLLWNLRKPIAKILEVSRSNRNRRAAQVFNAPSKESIKDHVFSQEQYLFSTAEITDLLVANESKIELTSPPLSSIRPLSLIEEQSFYDIGSYLKDDLLVKVDMASMLASLEVRVPLLDHEIVKYAMNLSQNLKFTRKGIQKHVLKEILTDLLPKELIDHPKWGFSIPLSRWLKNELSYLIENYLNEEIIEAAAIVKYSKVAELKDRFIKGEDYLYNKIWCLIVLHKWLKENDFA